MDISKVDWSVLLSQVPVWQVVGFLVMLWGIRWIIRTTVRVALSVVKMVPLSAVLCVVGLTGGLGSVGKIIDIVHASPTVVDRPAYTAGGYNHREISHTEFKADTWGITAAMTGIGLCGSILIVAGCRASCEKWGTKS